jgi:hypothetical protein
MAADDGDAAGEAVECFNPNAAVMKAEALSRHTGSISPARACGEPDRSKLATLEVHDAVDMPLRVAPRCPHDHNNSRRKQQVRPQSQLIARLYQCQKTTAKMPSCRTRLFRNAGRDHLGIPGVNHLGIPGRDRRNPQARQFRHLADAQRVLPDNRSRLSLDRSMAIAASIDFWI